MSRNFKEIFREETEIASDILAIFQDAILDENQMVKAFEDSFRTEIRAVPKKINKNLWENKKFTTNMQNKFISDYLLFIAKQENKNIREWNRDNLGFGRLIAHTFARGLQEIAKIANAQVQEQETVVVLLGPDGEETEKSEVFEIGAQDIEEFTDRRWTKDNKTIEERLAQLRKGAEKVGKEIFKRGLQSGESYVSMVRKMRRLMAFDAVKLERIIRTEGQRIQNDILLKTYHKNRKFLSGIEYTATLDIRTCQVCAGYDRNQYWYRQDPRVADAPYIPIHPRCRCIYVPISKYWEETKDFAQTRASEFGPTTGNYSEWIRAREKKVPGFARKVLSEKKYNLWLQGKFSFKKAAVNFQPQSTVRSFLRREKLNEENKNNN